VAAEQPRVYLAGPEVFFPNAAALGERKKKICADHGLEGVFPLDETVSGTDLTPPELAHAIFKICERLMDECEIAIANMTPFRSVSMDVGTAIELGYMAGQGKRLYGYTNVAGDLKTRVAVDGYDIEDFELADNLMCEGVIRRSGGVFIRHSADPARLIDDLTGFERCVEAAARFSPT
jgi:nucleoside 2-deoxyribosyltransferase